MVDPQTYTDAELRRRMRRFIKLEPTYLAAMVDNERNYWVPKRDIPVPQLKPLGGCPFTLRVPTYQD